MEYVRISGVCCSWKRKCGVIVGEDGYNYLAFCHQIAREQSANRQLIPGDEVTFLRCQDSRGRTAAGAIELAVPRPLKPAQDLHGEIYSWDETRGFGFIKTADWTEVFFHRKNAVDGFFPDVGIRVVFDVGEDFGRLRGLYVRPE